MAGGIRANITWQWELIDHARKIEPVYQPLMFQHRILRTYVRNKTAQITQQVDFEKKDLDLVRHLTTAAGAIQRINLSSISQANQSKVAFARQTIQDFQPEFLKRAKERSEFYSKLTDAVIENATKDSSSIVILGTLEETLYSTIFGSNGETPEEIYQTTLDFFDSRSRYDIALAHLTEASLAFGQVIAEKIPLDLSGYNSRPQVYVMEAVAKRAHHFYEGHLQELFFKKK